MIITEHQLIGAWRLLDYVLLAADGNQSRPWREGSTGLLLYAANGYMSAATAVIVENRGEAIFMSYHGSYDLYEDRVVHHIEISTDSGLVGRDQVRRVAYDGETLTLTASPSVFGGAGSKATISWRRAQRS